MLVIGLDAALGRPSVAIMRNGEPLSVRRAEATKSAAEMLPLLTAEALSEAGVAATDLDRIGVTVGPGGFSGVRVGLSFARAFALAAGVEIVGVTSLAVLSRNALSAGEDECIASMIDARRGGVYAALYNRTGGVLTAPFLSDPHGAMDALLASAAGAGVIGVGSGFSLIEPPQGWRVGDDRDKIDPYALAQLAAAAPRPSGPPAPVYLRPPDAKRSTQQRGARA